MSIDYPGFYFLSDLMSVYPLLGIDAAAWLVVALMTGRAEVPPTPEGMKAANRESFLENLRDYPHIRLSVDPDYWDAYSSLQDSWSEDLAFERYSRLYDEAEEYSLNMVALMLREGGHSLQLWDESGNTTEHGKTFLENHEKEAWSRFAKLEGNPTLIGQTFRDYKWNAGIRSMFTGTASSVLPVPWLQIEGDGTSLILGRTASIGEAA